MFLEDSSRIITALFLDYFLFVVCVSAMKVFVLVCVVIALVDCKRRNGEEADDQKRNTRGDRMGPNRNRDGLNPSLQRTSLPVKLQRSSLPVKSLRTALPVRSGVS